MARAARGSISVVLVVEGGRQGILMSLEVSKLSNFFSFPKSLTFIVISHMVSTILFLTW